MNWHQLERRIQNEFIDAETRLITLKSIEHRRDPERLVVLAHGCLANHPAIAAYCQNAIKQLPASEFQILLDFIFNGKLGTSGKKLFELMDELRSQEMMQYILREIDSQKSSEMREYHRLALWLQETGIIEKYLRIILKFPLEVAKNALIAMTRLDGKVPIYLANMATSFSVEMKLKILKLFKYINNNSKVAMLLLRKLTEHPNPEVRARTAYLIGRTLQNAWFVNHILKDPVPQVRLSILKSIATSSTPSPRMIDLLSIPLKDKDGRVCAKAAQILYLYKDRHGLRKLISMLSSPSPLFRASAVHYLGELKEVSARNQLQQLAQEDPDVKIRLFSSEALRKLDDHIDDLGQQLTQLDHLLARHRLSRDDETGLLWSCLEDLDAEAIKGIIRSIDLAPEAVGQIMAIFDDVQLPGTALPLLLATLIDEEGKVNNQKITDLNQVRAESDKIVQQLQSGDAAVVARLFDDLTNAQRHRVRRLFVSALQGGPIELQAVAAKKLLKLGYDYGQNKLVEMASHSDRNQRVEAVKTLSTMANPFALEQLKRLVKDPDAEIQQLARMGQQSVQARLERSQVQGVNLTVKNVDTTEFPRVKLQVTVSNEHNQALSDIELNDFTILEENRQPVKPKQLEVIQNQGPLAVSVVMDYSASMTETAIGDIEAATRLFIDQLIPGDYAAIIKFAEEIEVTQKLTADKACLRRAIGAGYQLSKQGTALYDSIFRAMDELDAAKAGVKIILVTTDGEDTASARKDYEVTSRGRHRNMAVYPISLGEAVDTNLLKQIANSTGGSYYAAVDSSELREIYTKIANTIRLEYEIDYQSSYSRTDADQKTVEIYVEYGKHKVKDNAVFPAIYRTEL